MNRAKIAESNLIEEGRRPSDLSKGTSTTNLRMRESHTSLLVIDLQRKLINNIAHKDLIVWNTRKLIEATKILSMQIKSTEQNPNKLGPTITEIDDLLDEKPFSKMSFSCIECKGLIDGYISSSVDTILICGIETHVCVQQTALDLISEGFNVYIVIDAIGSRNILDHEIAIKRLAYAGAILSTTESAIFELCSTAQRPEFNKISSIIKKTQSDSEK